MAGNREEGQRRNRGERDGEERMFPASQHPCKELVVEVMSSDYNLMRNPKETQHNCLANASQFLKSGERIK